jgi:large subunit ribosomal protein L19
MNTVVMNKIQDKYMSKKIPDVKAGDTVEVDTIIREGAKQRVQKFRGLVIAVKGSGTSKMITVRKISNGVGVEKKLPVYSPNISKIRIIKTEAVRRSKLYFMRDRIGKAALRVKKGKAVLVDESPVVDELSVESAEAPQASEEQTPSTESK